jgi:hypothetical protein
MRVAAVSVVLFLVSCRSETPSPDALVDSINTATNTIDPARVPHAHGQYLETASGGTLKGPLVGTTASFSGTVRIGNGTQLCSSFNAGELRFDPTLRTLFACDGTAWIELYRRRANGLAADTAAESCKSIIDDGYSTGDGVYWIVAKSAEPFAFQAYCDMTTAGGGWTLVAKLDGASSVMNRVNTAQWLDGVSIGNTTTLVAENAMGRAYNEVAFTDVMIRSLANASKRLGWRHPSRFNNMRDVVRGNTPVSNGSHLFGSVSALDYDGSAANHNDCSDLRYGFLGFDFTQRFPSAKPRVTGHTGGIVAASRFWNDGSAGPVNCVSDFGFGGGYADMVAADDQININAHRWNNGNDFGTDFNPHGLFIR